MKRPHNGPRAGSRLSVERPLLARRIIYLASPLSSWKGASWSSDFSTTSAHPSLGAWRSPAEKMKSHLAGAAVRVPFAHTTPPRVLDALKSCQEPEKSGHGTDGRTRQKKSARYGGKKLNRLGDRVPLRGSRSAPFSTVPAAYIYDRSLKSSLKITAGESGPKRPGAAWTDRYLGDAE